MKVLIIILIAASAFVTRAQDDLRKMVDTEIAFAKLAAEKGTRHAFLANMSDDAVIFTPDRTVAKS